MKVHGGSDSLLGNTSDFRADWRGLGLAGQTTDPDGNVASEANKGVRSRCCDEIHRP
jgi:hypothetical protein